MKDLFLIFLAVIFATPIFAQTTVEVTITGIENTDGNVVIGFYNSEETFPDYGKEIQGKEIKLVKTGSLSYTFENLPEGTYAIAAWHDENSNQKLDKNLFGVPKEKYGFSKNIYGTFGPPDFDDVSFKAEKGKSMKLTINLK